MKIQVLGTGYALPQRVLTNQELEKIVQTSDQWIVERTGIRERRISEPETGVSNLVLEAARAALDKACIHPRQLDLIIVATVTPDMVFPSTACLVQGELGATGAAAFDMEAGCTGFVYALTAAEKFLLAPGYRYALVVGADLLSRITDYTDRSTCVLFGDGAGAFVLGRNKGRCGIIGTKLGADGTGAGLLYMPAGGSLRPPSEQTVAQKMHYIKMNGNEVFKFAVKTIVEVCNCLLESAHLTWDDVDLFVPHQANIRIIKTAAKRLNLPASKVFINIDRVGNISAASIPIALAQAEEQGRLQPGQLVLAVGFGAGLTYGGALIRWGREEI
ncbi:MAG: beta-ketoacyl-ACP synthase III [Chitinophagales bacterium]